MEDVTQFMAVLGAAHCSSFSGPCSAVANSLCALEDLGIPFRVADTTLQ